ncbi:Molybdenum cofactor biosynthesis protein MoaB [Trichostrongylus colubriformis]|uniref:molybdopterin molybdotransferase n=1 Tax=Trichostrongylus colubriformis TaxID=6319 RepID=A0AAN8J1K3_TRICO
MRFSVLTVSDSCAAGTREDVSGPTLVELIKHSPKIDGATISSTMIVPDERDMIEAALVQMAANSDVIITTGGTGFAKRDITPEATLNVVERRCTGLEVAIHRHSLQATPMAALSRAVAGIRDSTLIVNFPGSVKAVKECWVPLEPILHHAVNLLCHGHDGGLHAVMNAMS